MRTYTLLVGVWLIGLSISFGQQNAQAVKAIFPANTRFVDNVPYAQDTLKKHLLDLYLPPKTAARPPLVVWIHGGGWMVNDKYADIGYMTHTVRSILEKGYAFASIDYRHSPQAPFPGLIQDCNQAIEYLYQHAGQYGYDPQRIALIGFSAGGHLAAMVGLSNNNAITEFYPNAKRPAFRVKTVVDFYGPADLMAMIGRQTLLADTAQQNPERSMLGASPYKRPDLVRKGSPVTYVDANDPPFLLIHGEKDTTVPPSQSVILHSWLQLAKVPTELIIVPNAPHFGTMFDTDDIRTRVISWLDKYLK